MTRKDVTFSLKKMAMGHPISVYTLAQCSLKISLKEIKYFGAFHFNIHCIQSTKVLYSQYSPS